MRPWSLAIGAILLILLATVLDPARDLVASALYVGVVTSSSLVGALLRIRVPGNPVGGLLLATGSLLALSVASGIYGQLGAAASPPWPGTGLAAVLNDALFILPIVFTLIGVPLVFPDGRLPSRRFRWVAWLSVIAVSASIVASLLKAGPVGPSGIENPIAVPALAPLLDVFRGFASVTALIGFGGAAAALWVRFRSGDPVLRQQTKWLLATAAVAAVGFPVAFLVPWESVSTTAFVIGFVALLALPIAIGLAILRYRLYEIDRVISRTIGWAAITGLLLAVFAALVVGLQAMLAGFTQGETLAVAASTLVAFALFAPVRRRVQAAVDRRFNRARYDGERTAAAFGAAVRDETDPAGVERRLAAAAGETVQPTLMGVWLRAGAGRADR